MNLNLRKWLCPEKKDAPAPAYKPTLRRKMVPEDLTEKNLGKRVWSKSRIHNCLDEGRLVGYDASMCTVVIAEPSLYGLSFERDVTDCWIEMELEK